MFWMIAFLGWIRTIVVGTLNGVAMVFLFFLLLFGVLIGIGLAVGDGQPGKILLTLDLRSPLKDSADANPLDFGEHPPTVMDIVLALDQAGRDPRVKGLFVRVGSADLAIPRAEEIVAALKRFRTTGKFVIAHAQGFNSTGLGDYLAATGADEIWMQPKSDFGPAGTGAGGMFFKGLFDKINAVPQIAKRAEYKSAADTYMEKGFTGPDREQTTALLQSWYDNATTAVAANRGLDAKQVVADFEQSPQFADAALKEKLVDKLGYDDDAKDAAKTRAGGGNTKFVTISAYWKATRDTSEFANNGRVALIEASGEIVDGTLGGSGFMGNNDAIAGDDLAGAIRSATADKNVKVILLRIDSPGGSVAASDQILDAVKKAQTAGKPVVISMGMLAASGGYYVSCSADRIVAEPGTLTGSIGVLTGKVSIGKSLAMIGVGAEDIGVGKNALFDSSISPYTPDQWQALNDQADTIYADFTQKVAAGRKLPLAQVRDIARGRVWTGADAKPKGLVDELGGFWTAVADARKLAGIAPDERVVFKRFPEHKGFFAALDEALGGTSASMRAIEGLERVEEAPVTRAMLKAVDAAPRGGIEMRATGLPGGD
jgi:protease-4